MCEWEQVRSQPTWPLENFVDGGTTNHLGYLKSHGNILWLSFPVAWTTTAMFYRALLTLLLLSHSAEGEVYTQPQGFVSESNSAKIKYDGSCDAGGQMAYIDVPALIPSVASGNNYNAVICRRTSTSDGYGISYLRFSTPVADYSNGKKRLEIGCTKQSGYAVKYLLEWSHIGPIHYPSMIGNPLDSLAFYRRHSSATGILHNLNRQKEVIVSYEDKSGSRMIGLVPGDNYFLVGNYRITAISFGIPYRADTCGDNK